MYKHLRIFFVGSDPRILDSLSKTIKRTEHTLAGTAHLRDATFKRIDAKDPDLILMDFQSQEKEAGLALANNLTSRLNLPVIFLTSSPDELTISEVKKIGHYGILAKPVNESELKTEINFTFERFEKIQKHKSEIDSAGFESRETEQFFEQVVNNVSDIIYRIDSSGNFTYLNPSAIQSTGYEREALYHASYTSLVRSDFKRRISSFFQQMIRKDISDAYLEVPIIRKNGLEVWLGQNIHLLKRGDKVLGFQVVARDITSEIQYKEELINARRTAEQASELKAQFLANMSHEIRTPLNGIVGIVKLLEKTRLDDKQQNYLRAIVSSSNQLMGIINDILDLSKIDSGKMEINHVLFDLGELLHSLIEVMEIKASMRGISIVFELDERIPQFIIGDPVALNQILYNLIGNSLKFTHEGNVLLSVKLVDSKSEGDISIQFTVQDTGIGMRSEVLDGIFEAFTQAENATSREYGGTGLGLTIVKKLVTLHSGDITVESTEGIGSIFKVTLCFEKAQSNVAFIQQSASQDFSVLTDRRVLIVEDNFINQMVTRDLLEDLGMKVFIAENGKVALEVLENDRFDVVLMDMQMPVLDGFETMRIIRGNPDIAALPILALTANATRSEYEKCMSYGASDYLSKPFLPEDLFVKVSGLIETDEGEKAYPEVDIQLLSMYTNSKKSLMVSTLNELSQVLKSERLEIGNLFSESDLKGIRSRMHKLKPNFRLIGLNELVLLVESIERGQSLVEMKDNIDLLMDMMELADIKVTQVRDKLSSE